MLTKPSNVSTLRQLETATTTQTVGFLHSGVWRDDLNDTNTRNLQMWSDLNSWTKGKPTPAAGQIVEIVAQVTDTPFVPAGRDQITAFPLYNGFFASAAPPRQVSVIRVAAALR